MSAQARRVDFFNETEDHNCVLLAALGFSTAYICHETGLTPCQVSYRIMKGGFTKANGTSRMDFRNGTSPFAQSMIRAARHVTETDLIKHLNKNSL